MVERDALEALTQVANLPQDPDPEFARRLLDELLLDLPESSVGLFEPAADQDDALTVGDLDIELLTIEKETDLMPTKSKNLLLAAAAAAIVAIVGLVFVFSSGDDDSAPVITDTPEETELTDTTVPKTPSEAEAIAVAERFFAAYNAGDAEAVFALLSDGATFFNESGYGFNREEFELLTHWNLAQGTQLVDHECGVDAPGSSELRVSCTVETDDALTAAADGPTIPTTTTFRMAGEGLTEVRFIFGSPDFFVANTPFNAWMQATHPRASETVSCCVAETVADSVARGELLARYAEQWATHLAENGCTYTEPRCGWPSTHFTGSSCTYEGPTEFELGARVSLNMSTDVVGTGQPIFEIWTIPDGTTLLDISTNTIRDIGADEATDLRLASNSPSGVGMLFARTIDFDTPGLWALICVDPVSGVEVPSTLFTVSEP